VGQCPDKSWTLWGVNGTLDSGGWCCLAGATGAYQNSTQLGLSFGVGCYPDAFLAGTNTLAAAATVSTVSCTPSSSTVSSTSSSSTTASSTAASSTSASGSTNMPTSDTAGAQHVSSLSGGAIAGVVVGAVAGAALLGVLVFLLLRKKRRSSTGEPVAPAQEIYGKESQLYEVDGQQDRVHELPTGAERLELPSR